jgi:microcystin-dependent protein
MASTYTTRNRLEKQGSGENENTWGDILNTVIDLADESLDGFLEVDVSAADVTLTTNNGSSDQSRNRVLRIVGDLASARTITLPDLEKWYVIEVATSGSGNVEIKNTGATNGVTISAASPNIIVACDGTSVRTMITESDETVLDARYLLESNNLSDLTNVSAARVNLGVGTSSGLGGIATVSAVIEVIYPVGSIYTNATDGTNPGTLFGVGTWTSCGTGRVLVGAGTGTDVNGVSASFTATSTGGEYEHTQTSAEVGPHTHTLTLTNKSGNEVGGGSGTNWGGDNITGSSATATVSVNTTSAQAMNIQQPYLVVYYWQRDS